MGLKWNWMAGKTNYPESLELRGLELLDEIRVTGWAVVMP